MPFTKGNRLQSTGNREPKPIPTCVVCLRRLGFGVKTIRRITSQGAERIKRCGEPRWLGVDRNNNRTGRPTHKGPKPHHIRRGITTAGIHNMIMREYQHNSVEFSKTDECAHWALSQVGHPEYVKWYARTREAKHRKDKTNYYLAKLIRTRVYSVLKGNIKSAPTLRLLGCTLYELRCHLQSKFELGMSWNNQGAWHIDHIIPCAAFDLSKPEQQRMCFHYSNLQPLWASHNWSKHARIPGARRKSIRSRQIPTLDRHTDSSCTRQRLMLFDYTREPSRAKPEPAGLATCVKNP